MKVTCESCNIVFDKKLSQINKTKHNFCSRHCSGVFNGNRRKGPYRHSNPLPGGMTYDIAYKKVRELRQSGYGYKSISMQMSGLSWSTIRNWCSDITINANMANKKYHEKFERPFEDLTYSGSIRKRLIRERGNKCERCNISNWMDEQITLELHHCDGDGTNNSLDNLQILCPNCHSQTGDYRNRNHYKELDI